MGLGRRKAQIDSPEAWVFNKLVKEYAARPAYPTTVVDQVDAEVANVVRARHSIDTQAFDPGKSGTIVDIGSGIGHFALPLANRGHRVVALEPAERMLEALRKNATEAEAKNLITYHARAEALPLADGTADVALISDALHFIDVERTAAEVSRVLRPYGTLIVVVCRFGDTPFMGELQAVIERHADRRFRHTDRALTQLFKLCGRGAVTQTRLSDHTALSPLRLMNILESFSFVGPAFSESRRAAFCADVAAISPSPVWSRSWRIFSGRGKH